MGKEGRGWTLRLAGLLSPVTVWLGLFFLVPLLLILAYSFGTSGVYGGITLGFNPSNYFKVFDPLYLEIIVRTFVIALLNTFLCFLIGYPLAYFITFFHVPHNSAGHGSSDLAVQHLRTNRAFYYYRSALIFCARFRVPCYKIVSRVIAEILYNTRNRVTRNMHVDRRHENRDLLALIFKIFGLFHVFNYYHFTICRRDHQIFTGGQYTIGYAEKRNQEKKNSSVAPLTSRCISRLFWFGPD